jgi:hypothetical protein
MRGEIELRCPSDVKMLPAGQSVTCGAITQGRVAPRTATALRPEPSSPPPRIAIAPRSEPSPPPLALDAPPPSPESSPAPAAADPYALAESAMRRGDLAAACEALLAIVAAAPDSLDAATALLDLARIALRRGDTALALSYLDRLDRHPRSAALAAAAAHMRATLTRAGAARRPSPG